MKKLRKNLVLLMVSIAFLSCGNNGPIAYKSISGSWRCQEISSNGVQRTYIVQVDRKLSDTTQYLLSNFYNIDINEFVLVHLKGSNITITQQEIGTSPAIVESGSGVVSSNFTRIDFTYMIRDGLNDIKVNAYYTR